MKWFPRAFLIILFLCFYPVAALASEGSTSSGVSMTHRMMMLVIQLGVILFAAKLGNILFTKIKLPGALGELLVGILIGPFALGQFGFLGLPHGLFPMGVDGFAISPELYALGSVAAVILLFTVGLETDLKLLLRYSLVGGLVGIGGMVVSFFVGAVAVMLFSDMLFGESLGLFSPPCLFLGTITTATSVGITARVLSEKHKLESPEGVTILSAAVIDDVMGIILLAVIMGLLTASAKEGSVDWGHIGIIAAKAIGVWLFATICGLAASRKISFLLKWFGERTSIAIMAFGLALVLAGLFEEAGLAMVIGAYVMGLSLSRADIKHVVQEKLRPVYALLVPVFFCTTGMQIDLSALTSPSVLLFGVVYGILAMAAKVFGCGIPAFLTNFNIRGAARVGFGMAPRCEVALIIAGVGLASNLISPIILTGVIVMIIVNNVVAVPILAMLMNSPASGTRSDTSEDQYRESLPFEFTSIEMADFFAARLLVVFEAEGFFTHQLSIRERLFQLLKDKTVIDFRQSAETIIFTCDRVDVPLVNTAVREALAELERVIRELQQPLDTKPMLSKLQDSGPLGPAAFDMKGLLNEHLVTDELRATTKEGVIEELLEILRDAGLVRDIDIAKKAVMQRESSMSTGLQFGVAIPHGKTDTVDRLVCAVGISKQGLDFDSMDGELSRIFVLTLSPESKPAPHIQFMSTISHVLNRQGRRQVIACDNRRQLYIALTTHD